MLASLIHNSFYWQVFNKQVIPILLLFLLLYGINTFINVLNFLQNKKEKKK